MTHLDHKNLRSIIIENINHNKKNYISSKNIILPDFISNHMDSYYHSIKKIKGNYITNKKITGRCFVLKNKKEKLILNNKIILIKNADPGFDFLFNYNIKGLVTMYGGPNSHMSIRCSELQIPAIIGIGE